MPRELFHQELAEIQKEILVMGSMAEKATHDALESLRTGDLEWAQRIVEEDSIIDQKRYEIEEKTIFVVASQQPMATDLRTLISALYIITDLERIADHAEGIARINIMLGDNSELPRQLGYIPKMGELSTTMLRDSLKAYIDSDIDEARRICEADDEVDRLQDAVYADAFKSMIDDNLTIQDNTYRLWTAHNLERIADRCTNICERIIFIVTGSMSEAARDVSKY
ncbi:MAG: phosphate signaling complex protein PhoU [Dehalococcoidia bacterium]|nr:phosphate signaling complex protein PhoU [Dehalococcoidia bacterium]